MLSCWLYVRTLNDCTIFAASRIFRARPIMPLPCELAKRITRITNEHCSVMISGQRHTHNTSKHTHRILVWFKAKGASVSSHLCRWEGWKVKEKWYSTRKLQEKTHIDGEEGNVLQMERIFYLSTIPQELDLGLRFNSKAFTPRGEAHCVHIYSIPGVACILQPRDTLVPDAELYSARSFCHQDGKVNISDTTHAYTRVRHYHWTDPAPLMEHKIPRFQFVHERSVHP